MNLNYLKLKTIDLTNSSEGHNNLKRHLGIIKVCIDEYWFRRKVNADNTIVTKLESLKGNTISDNNFEFIRQEFINLIEFINLNTQISTVSKLDNILPDNLEVRYSILCCEQACLQYLTNTESFIKSRPVKRLMEYIWWIGGSDGVESLNFKPNTPFEIIQIAKEHFPLQQELAYKN